jgi:hypothetical protein
MENKKRIEPGKTIIGLIAILLLILIIKSCSLILTPAEKDNIDHSLPMNDQVTTIIKNEIGLSTNLDKYKDRIRTISVDDNKITLSLFANSNSDKELLKSLILDDTKKVMNQLKNNYDNLEEVEFLWWLPLYNQYGEENVQVIVTLRFENETIYKTNWDKIDYKNIENIADYKKFNDTFNK